mgnify:CR=1 FL=1
MFERVFVEANKWALIAILAAMACIVFANVSLRYLTNYSITWAEEVARYLMIWMTFLGAGLALAQVLELLDELADVLSQPPGQYASWHVQRSAQATWQGSARPQLLPQRSGVGRVALAQQRDVDTCRRLRSTAGEAAHRALLRDSQTSTEARTDTPSRLWGTVLRTLLRR